MAQPPTIYKPGKLNYLWNYLGSSLKSFAAALSPYLGGGSEYKSYIALLTQTGIDPPVVNVIYNSLPGDIVWTRPIAGTYTGTLAGAFTLGKTTMNVWLNYDTCTAVRASCTLVDVNELYANTYSGFNFSTADLGGNGMYVEIRVYP